MGFLQSVFQKEEKKKHKLGVCIPDATRGKKEEKAEEPILQEKGFANAKGKSFAVLGIFHVQDSLMVQGEAMGSAIKKKDKFSFGGTRFWVKDIQAEGRQAWAISPGQKGALFLKAEKGKFPIIRIGDVLEF